MIRCAGALCLAVVVAVAGSAQAVGSVGKVTQGDLASVLSHNADAISAFIDENRIVVDLPKACIAVKEQNPILGNGGRHERSQRRDADVQPVRRRSRCTALFGRPLTNSNR
jgi:hypothetical protein